MACETGVSTPMFPNEPASGGAGDSEVAEEAVLSAALTSGEVRERAVRGAVLLGGRALAGRLLGMVSTVLLARLLRPRDFGAVAFGMAVIGLAGFLADAGIGAGLIRGREDIRKADLEAVLGFQVLISVTAAVAVGAAALLLGGEGELTALMALSLPIAAFSTPGAILLERQLSYRPLAAVEMIETAAYYLWAITTVALGAGVWGLATAVVVREVVGTLGTLVVAPAGRVRPRFAWRRIQRLVGFGARFQAVGLVAIVRDFAINAGTASIGGLSMLGVWSFAESLLQAPFLIFETLWRISYPALARLLAIDDDPAPAMELGLLVVGVASGLIVAGLVGSAPALVPSVFAPRWGGAVSVLPWAGASLAFAGPISVVSAGYLYAKGDATRVLVATAASDLLWVGLGLGLMPVLGVRSLGVGLLAAGLAGSSVLIRGVRRRLRIRFVPTLAPSMIAAAGAAMTGWLVARRLGPTLLSTAASALAVAATYFAILAIVNRRHLTETWRVVSVVLRRRTPAAGDASVELG